MSDKPICNWLIVTWEHIDHQDAAYGKLLATFHGTEEEAQIEARNYVSQYKPVGIVREIQW